MNKMTKATLIKSRDRVQDVGEVFTPDFLVERMLDRFPSDAWKPNKDWLEPTCGNGQFILGILRRKIKTGSTLLQALDSTFGADIMKDNVSECHIRIYAEIAIPYWREHKIRGNALKRERLRAVCLVEHHIRHTKDSLKEDFEKWQRFDDTTQTYKDKFGSHAELVLKMVDEGATSSLPKLLKRLHRELIIFQEI